MWFDSPILLDVSRLIWRAWRRQLPTGIDRACLAYVRYYHERALAVLQRGGFTRVLGRRPSRRLFDLLLERPADFRAELLRLLGPQFVPGRAVGERALKDMVYLNIGHTGLDRPGHGLWVMRTGVRAVYYIHDLIPITHPQFARAQEPQRHAARMESVLRYGRAVLANSQDSIAALNCFAAKGGFAVPETLLVPLGVEQNFYFAHPRPLAEPYFVVLGTIEARKNHALLLDVWRALAERLGNETPRLVIIGQRGWSVGDVLYALDEDERLRPLVLELGRCSDEELHQWLTHAQALLFPSFVEGQGLPLIEALAAATPVIASDLSVFRETAGDIPEYLDPNDVDAWTQVVLSYTSGESTARNAQLSRMEKYRPPTWDEHFQKVDQWLGELE
jgi:glycosyltransferase involved in cell wall biosynthesis